MSTKPARTWDTTTTQVSDASAASDGTLQTSNKSHLTDASFSSKDDSASFSDPTNLLNPGIEEDSVDDCWMEASFIEEMPSDLPLPVPAPLSTPGAQMKKMNAKEEAVKLNLADSDH